MLAAGHDPEHLLNTYSWEQIELWGYCIARHHIGMVEMVVEPVMAAMGIEYKAGSVSRGGEEKPVRQGNRPPPRRGKRPGPRRKVTTSGGKVVTTRSFKMGDYDNDADKEAGLLAAFGMMGRPVTDKG